MGQELSKDAIIHTLVEELGLSQSPHGTAHHQQLLELLNFQGEINLTPSFDVTGTSHTCGHICTCRHNNHTRQINTSKMTKEKQ